MKEDAGDQLSEIASSIPPVDPSCMQLKHSAFLAQLLLLGGSSCMVKNDGKGRKMTGFQRQQIIVVLMDISGPSRTSMAKEIFL